MLRTDFPIKFDDTEIIFPLTWNESFSDIVTKNVTEDGHDHVLFTRKGKLTISASWYCTDMWARTFKYFADKTEFVLSMYDVLTQAYKSYDVRIHEFQCELRKGSWELGATNGTWDVSFTIEEY